MTEIRFYHLQSQSPEQALPALVSKAFQNGHKIIVKMPAGNIAKTNDYLWTHSPESFLPHGCEKDGNAELQPIWLTDKDENPNNADLLVLTHNLEADNFSDFKIVCEIFDGRIDEDVSAARQRWKNYKDQGFDLTYWQQTAQGGWDKKS